MRRIEVDQKLKSVYWRGASVEMSLRDFRLMRAVVKAADNLRDCNYNEQHKDNPIAVLNDALDAFNAPDTK